MIMKMCSLQNSKVAHFVKAQREECSCAPVLAVLDVALAGILKDLLVQGLEALNYRAAHFVPAAALVGTEELRISEFKAPFSSAQCCLSIPLHRSTHMHGSLLCAITLAQHAIKNAQYNSEARRRCVRYLDSSSGRRL